MEAFSPKHCLWKATGKSNETKTAVGSYSGQHSASPAPPPLSLPSCLLKLPLSIFMYVHVLHFKWLSSWFSCTESCGLLIARLVLMGFTQILVFLQWGCSACRWFQLPCRLGRVSQPGTKCPARPPAELSPSLGQCGRLWLSPAAQTFVCLSPKATSGAAVGTCMVLLFVGEQQYVKHQSCCRQQRVRIESVLEAASKFTLKFSYFSLLCIAIHSCTRIIYSSQRQLIWTEKTLAGGKMHILSSLPTPDWWEKNKGGEAKRTRSGKELKAEAWFAFGFLYMILCAQRCG